MTKNAFSKDSNVTVVLTSCGRFDLLKKTLNTFFEKNSYPIKQLIITEDSGDNSVSSVIPEKYREYCTVIINQPKLGQIKSIDKAYALVDTDYIFHSEDDWDFYREGFIEDSLKILEADKNVYQVWLRSFYHDVKRDYPFHSLGTQFKVDQVIYHKLLSSKEKWQGFSFNPGLRRTSDYLEIAGGYSSFLSEEHGASLVESSLSAHMKKIGMFAAILDNDAVAHIGYEEHIQDNKEKKKKGKRKIEKLIMVLIVFTLGIAMGLSI